MKAEPNEMKDKLRIRKMLASDAEELAKIEKEAFSMPWSKKAISELADIQYGIYLTAEYEGSPVGLAGLKNAAGEGEIDKVMVKKDLRRMGIADALLSELIRTGDAEGISAYTLEVRVSNAPAIGLYEKHGFVSEGVRPGFYDAPKEDALIMWKRN